MKLWDTVKEDIRTDVTWNRAARLATQAVKELPRASVRYALEKLPIIEWLPNYNPRWLINDIVAGLTIGLMLLPQSLSYAKIATIPEQYGLMSSWLPTTIYAVMGTSKDISVGPTSLMGLLTHEIVASMPEHAAIDVASASAMLMGIYGMILGFFKLGFILDFISEPILSGFISGVAFTIILNQMPSLLGESDVRTATASLIHDIFAKLPHANGYDCAIGFSGIIFLAATEHAGKRWGKRNKLVWFLSITRAFLALVLFTGISYAVNNSRQSRGDYLFGITQVHGDGIQRPRVPNGSLLGKVAGRSVSLFIAAAVEHMSVARRFAAQGNYVIDQSQELSFLGVVNFFNSFFRSMGVGGAMSRSAVNYACNVKSPLSGFLTTAVVLVSIYELIGVLFWTPKATLAAIIITAVYSLISPPKVFYRYWKSSFVDWMSSMLSLWITLFVSTEIGLAVSIAFNIVYFMLRQVFSTVDYINVDSPPELLDSLDDAREMPLQSQIAEDVHIFRFTGPIFFPNASRLTTKVMDAIQLSHAPSDHDIDGASTERNWSVAGKKRIERARKAAGIVDASTLPLLRLIILDFAKATFVDTTGLSYLTELIAELRKYAGSEVEIRFAGISANARQRFERSQWRVVDSITPADVNGPETIRNFRTVRDAVLLPRRKNTITSDIGSSMMKAETTITDVEKAIIAHNDNLVYPGSAATTLCD